MLTVKFCCVPLGQAVSVGSGCKVFTSYLFDVGASEAGERLQRSAESRSL